MSVGWFITIFGPAKMAEQIEMPFGMWAQETVYYMGSISPCMWAVLRGKKLSVWQITD